MENKLDDKKKALQDLLQQKAAQLQNADNIKNQITTEVIELQGKIKMIEELINENKGTSEEVSNQS